MDDEIFIAKYVVDTIDTEDLVEFAHAKVGAGIWSDHFLSILDRDPKLRVPISGYFKKSIHSLGYKIPSREEALWRLLMYHISLICDGQVSPTKQFQELLKDINWFYLNKGIKQYVGDNIGISRMFGWYYEDYCSLEQIDNGILEESHKWIRKYGQSHLQSKLKPPANYLNLLAFVCGDKF